MVEKAAKKPAESANVVELSSLSTKAAAEAGRWMQAYDPQTGVELEGMRLLVFGEDSKHYGKAMNAIADRKAAGNRARRSEQHLKYSDVEMSELLLAVHLTSGWEGFVENGKDVPCDFEAKLRIFKEYRWLAQQVIKFARDIGNFMPS